MDYTYSVFMGFQKAVKKDTAMKSRLLLNVVRVAASDDNKRCDKVWKDLSK
jgi:hypothetical protein